VQKIARLKKLVAGKVGWQVYEVGENGVKRRRESHDGVKEFVADSYGSIVTKNEQQVIETSTCLFFVIVVK
jgi:hypothetical protein